MMTDYKIGIYFNTIVNVYSEIILNLLQQMVYTKTSIKKLKTIKVTLSNFIIINNFSISISGV